ncbi:unnamed protein product, partial [Agarophyton chilense]
MGDELVHQLKRESQRLLLEHGNKARKMLREAQHRDSLSPGVRRGMTLVDHGLKRGIRSAEQRFDKRAAQHAPQRGPTAALRNLQ